ncbi:MAG: DUF2062 domain-containing protein [Thermodesulfobacteriota bacterium]
MGTNNKQKQGLFTKLKRKNRLLYLRVLRQTDSPEKIALGAAIGVASGILPTFGFGALLALGISYVVGANKVASVLGSFIMNPITTPFFWSLSTTVGGIIFWEDWGSIVSTVNNHDVFGGVKWALVIFLSGNIIVSLCFAFASYFIVKALIIRHREKKLAKKRMQISGSRLK